MVDRGDLVQVFKLSSSNFRNGQFFPGYFYNLLNWNTLDPPALDQTKLMIWKGDFSLLGASFFYLRLCWVAPLKPFSVQPQFLGSNRINYLQKLHDKFLLSYLPMTMPRNNRNPTGQFVANFSRNSPNLAVSHTGLHPPSHYHPRVPSRPCL